jgi:NAD(P)H-flavin reductase/ferredoxin
MPEVTLVGTDGASVAFACAQESTVLEAAAAAGFFLTAMCRKGTCGLCHAHVADGRYELAPCGSDALRDADRGGVLLCRCRPRTDLVVQLPYAQSGIARQEILARDATIERLERAGSNAVRMTLLYTPDPVLGQAADFTPGQYMEVTIPGASIQRAYSPANLPNWEGRLEFLIRLQPYGLFSTYLRMSAKVGDRLIVRGPLGNFVLDETSPRPRCLVGGGGTMAPMLSMLRHLADYEDMQPTRLIYGATREDELFGGDEIDALREALPQLSVTFSVLQPGPTWTGCSGTAVDALADYLRSNQEAPDIYVCGPAKLLEAVTGVARERGIPEAQIVAQRIDA